MFEYSSTLGDQQAALLAETSSGPPPFSVL